MWVYNKLKDQDIPADDPMKDIFKMVKYLYTKEWKPKFEKYLNKSGKDEKEEPSKKQSWFEYCTCLFWIRKLFVY